MSSEFYRRVAEGRMPFLRKAMNPNRLYIGRDEYIQLRHEVKDHMAWPVEGKISTYMGLEIHLVGEDSHFAVARVEDA